MCVYLCSNLFQYHHIRVIYARNCVMYTVIHVYCKTWHRSAGLFCFTTCYVAAPWHNCGTTGATVGSLWRLVRSNSFKVQLAAAALETTRKPWLFHHWEMASSSIFFAVHLDAPHVQTKFPGWTAAVVSSHLEGCCQHSPQRKAIWQNVTSNPRRWEILCICI